MGPGFGKTRNVRHGVLGTGVDTSEISGVPALSKEAIEEYERKGALIKLLLLGAGESGKSTMLKQMRLLHGKGFSTNYKAELKPLICYNVIEGAAAVIEAMKLFGFQLPNEELTAASMIVLAAFANADGLRATLTPEVVAALLKLVDCQEFKNTLKRSSEFQLQDGWFEFAKQLRRYPEWGGPEWLPSKEDILLSRVRTTGTNSEYFRVKDHMFQMIDVGGQMSERKIWLKAFKGIHAMIFVSSLSEYDQTLFDVQGENRLHDSIVAWHQYANHDHFKQSALILFLNKFDLFQQKYFYIKKPLFNPLPDKFPHAPPTVDQEKDENCSLALDWYKELFKSQVYAKPIQQVFIHVTTAVDAKNMENVIQDTTNFIVYRILDEAGLKLLM